jgi:sulfatase maturation enzyme AslB (radical SAM superfamily)
VGTRRGGLSENGPEALLDSAERALARLGGVPSAWVARDAGRLRILGLALTSGCNLRCRYCYQDLRRAGPMDWEAASAGLDVLLASGSRQPEVLLYGGEPLLEPLLIRKILKYVHDRQRPGTSVRFTLSTNGILLDGKVAALLARNHVRTELSFDGVATAQDERGPGTFASLDRLLLTLRRDHPRFFREDLGVRITLTSRNLGCLADSIAYFVRRDVRRISIAELATHDPEWRVAMAEELDRQLARAYKCCVEHYARTGEISVSAFRPRRPRVRAAPREVPMCGVRWGDRAIVGADGHTFACAALVGSSAGDAGGLLGEAARLLDLGDIRDATLPRRLASIPASLRASRLFNHKERKRSTYRGCAGCPALHDCGVCPVSIGHIPGNGDADRVPDLACAVNLVTSRYRECFRRETAAPQGEKAASAATRGSGTRSRGRVGLGRRGSGRRETR